MRVMYLITIGGKPAAYDENEGQITYLPQSPGMRPGRTRQGLEVSRAECLRVILKSNEWRKAKGLPKMEYGIVRIGVPDGKGASDVE